MPFAPAPVAPRVLVVDDHRKIREPLATYLRRHTFDVRTAEDAAGMWQLLKTQAFDVVVLDVLLPDGDGFELCNQLHRRSNTPVILLTARDTAADRTHVFSPAGWAPLRLRSSVPLPNGTYLNAVQYPAGAYECGRVLAYSLPVTTLLVLLIVMFFIARVVRPIKTLAQATERVSRGEWIAPLPEIGPQEARDLTAAFNTMQANLARHVEGRTRMLAAVSHDLNTPITELRLQVELLEPGDARDDMLESIAQLSAMVRETLNFVRDDAVQEATATMSMSGLLDDLAKRYQRMRQPVSWAGAPHLMLTCRPLALKRALTNVIDNALHHAGDAHLSLIQEDNGWLRIEVLDHGQGLPEAWLDKVFEPFVQRGVSDGGVGLGLAIARSCIQAHGGELVLQNRPPAGLCAVVRLPAAL